MSRYGKLAVGLATAREEDPFVFGFPKILRIESPRISMPMGIVPSRSRIPSPLLRQRLPVRKLVTNRSEKVFLLATANSGGFAAYSFQR